MLETELSDGGGSYVIISPKLVFSVQSKITYMIKNNDFQGK